MTLQNKCSYIGRIEFSTILKLIFSGSVWRHMSALSFWVSLSLLVQHQARSRMLVRALAVTLAFGVEYTISTNQSSGRSLLAGLHDPTVPEYQEQNKSASGGKLRDIPCIRNATMEDLHFGGRSDTSSHFEYTRRQRLVYHLRECRLRIIGCLYDMVPCFGICMVLPLVAGTLYVVFRAIFVFGGEV